VKFAVIVLTMTLSAGAEAVCGPPKEYAQYKDKAATKAGRDTLTDLYCLYAELRSIERNISGRLGKEVQICTAEMGKIMDALEARKDRKATDKAVRCGSKHP
jgi:hypothetical protein